MPKNLVIVESPAKAKTIEKYLGKDYSVTSSYGHIADLPKKDMGISVENDFEPEYQITADKKSVVKELKAKAKKADMVWLASDEDREGEAIAWHLYNFLDLDDKKTKRIVFNEITKKAILKAIENPRQIDKHLVDAQQARRVLDRLVGFEMSPILWRKIKPGLSAGRVQSVAVRLIVEKELDIQNFTPEASFQFKALFKKEDKQTVPAKLTHKFVEKEEAEEFINICVGANFKVSKVEKKPAKRTPSAPFTTSTLQQEASRKLGYSVARTMQLAQRLYEAGHITYMRTDSVNLSLDALNAIEATVRSEFGDKYTKRRNYKSKNKSAQEAHEAIRPTNFSTKLAGADSSQQRLYELIWKRTMASQMAEAQLERTVVDIENNKNDKNFRAQGEVIVFDGFLRLYVEGTDDEDVEDSGLLPVLKVGENLNSIEIIGEEKFTRPPARFTEASLVKRLEELGIGRPSTYAPTISTIQKRGYVEKGGKDGKERAIILMTLKNDKVKVETKQETYGADRNKLMPTDIGMVVNEFLVEHFDQVLDYHFTAKVEEDFDLISEGALSWKKNIKDFYGSFHKNIERVSENAERAKGERLLGKDPASGKNIYAKIGRYGPMVQIGESTDEEKPQFASLLKSQSVYDIELDEALKLFAYPKNIGEYEGKTVEVNAGRFGPYVKFDGSFVSIPKGEEMGSVDLERAVQLIEEKRKQDAPIATYDGKDVTKGKGRFGPFIKWNDLFINVNKKYDFDNLSQSDIKELIEAKLKKEKEKVVQNWEKEGIRVEKARWGRHHIIQGKLKIEIPKEVDAKALSVEDVKKIIAEKKKK